MSVCCGFDLGFTGDASAAAIVRRDGDGRYTLVAHLEQRPSKGAPLVPGDVLAAIAALCKRHGCSQAWGDNHYSQTSKEELAKQGIGFTLSPQGNSGKLETWTKAKELVLSRCVSTPDVPALLAQLKIVRSKPLPGGGTSILQPRKRGSHGDLASAFVLALWAASQHVEWPAGPLYFRAPDPRHDDMGRQDSRSWMFAPDWDD